MSGIRRYPFLGQGHEIQGILLLCDSQATSTWLDRETNTCAEASQHVDQRVGAEQVDAASQEVADARLRHSKDLGRLPLL